MILKLAAEPEIVKEGPALLPWLKWYHVPFSSYTVISNCQMQHHQNNQSSHPWYDLLVTVGEYSGGCMTLPGLGIEMDYAPGAVVGLNAHPPPCHCHTELELLGKPPVIDGPHS